MLLFFFSYEDSYKGNVTSETTILAGFGQVCPLSNQIAKFFDHEYLWKESIDILDILHEEIH